MSHQNAPLSFEGRRRLVERSRTRPIAHVAAEMGISRACASKRVNRWRRHGDAGLHDRPSAPRRSPNATPAWIIEQIESWRRTHKWSAHRITEELADLGLTIDRRTVTRHLSRLGLGQRRFIDPGGENNRKPGKIIARWPGHMGHLDVKKVGRINGWPNSDVTASSNLWIPAPGSARAAASPLSGSVAACGSARAGYFGIWRAITVRWVWSVSSQIWVPVGIPSTDLRFFTLFADVSKECSWRLHALPGCSAV
ncbi:transposase [Spinactinospora alkalitolerans]|uniref:Transposase n=1 Tax=Spinactinospora alkalitolerans TaxID=687207 RepID=A0A852TVI5_9ACTN|nr:transposase [Spinactinospora alkalitolerans]